MRCRFLLCAIALGVLAACGGGGGGGTNPGTPPVVQSTPTPATTPAPYATLPPASARTGDVRTLATGGGASAIAYWPDYNVLVVGYGAQIVDAANGSVLVKTPDTNSVTAVAYAPGNHSIYYATATDVYSFAFGGPVLTLATNLQRIESLAVASDGTVYAFDTDHIVKISGGIATTLTPPGSIAASYNQASPSMVVANDGSLLVSDPGNDAIDQVTTSGSITPFAGSCKAAANGFTGTNGSCWRLPQAGTGTAANFGIPAGLAYDTASGTLYVADLQSNQLWSVSASASAAPVAGYGATFNADGNGLAAFLNAPNSLAFQPASRSVDILENAPAGQQEIVAYTAAGTAAPAYTPPALPFYFPNGLAISELGAAPDGGAWTADANQKNIVHLSSTGAVTRYATPSAVAPTWHVAVDANGNAWFLASHTGSYGIPLDQGVLEVTPSGTQTYTAAAAQHSGGTVQMQGITIGPDGNPWFSESETWMYGGSFGFVNAASGTMTQYATSTGLGYISPGPGGTLAFGTTVASKPGIQFTSTSGQLGSAYPITLNSANSMQYRPSDSTIWFTDVNGSIGSLNASGVEKDYIVCGNCDPVDLTIAPDGSVWGDEANGGNGGIIRITPSGQVLQYLLPISYGPTYGISARPDGKLWVYNNFGVLFLFDPAAYDAMNGPHPASAARRSASAVRSPWHKW